MANPDGVIYGNFRCNLSGADLNRQWISPSKILHSVPFALGQMLKSYSHTEISFFIDLHGHSKKINSFIYACKSEEKSKNKYLSRIYPLILSKISHIFSLNDCTFGLNYFQEKTARALMWYSLSSSNVFTVETSAFGYADKSRAQMVVNFTPQNLVKFGQDVLKAVYAHENQDDSEYDVDQNNIIQYIEKNSQNFHDIENNQSGSDSEPCADEYSTKEKITKFLSGKMAQQVDMSNSYQSKSLYSESRSKEAFMKKYKKKPETAKPNAELLNR